MKISFFKKLSLHKKIDCGIYGNDSFWERFFLMLPIASTDGESIGFLTALFTITSAVCVTGLTVIDISKELTTAGQIIVLIFIQLGGLGVMTFSSFIFLLIGKKITYEERELLKEERNAESNGGVLGFLKKVIITIVVIEGIGAFFLAARFSQDMSMGKAVYFGIFHSISAFVMQASACLQTGLKDMWEALP